jgi:hypothetical protein
MEEAVPTHGATGNTLAQHQAVALEVRFGWCSPGRLGKMDAGGEIAGTHRVT